jgi:hypothetical protein
MDELRRDVLRGQPVHTRATAPVTETGPRRPHENGAFAEEKRRRE